jgi:hypothetical protein
MRNRNWVHFTIAAVTLLATANGADRAVLTGKVVDANGLPVEHATVLVYHAGVKHGYSTFCPSCYVDCGKRTITDKGGSFTITSLSPDLFFELLIVDDGYLPTFVEKVDPLKPAPTAALKLREAVTDPNRLVRGVVLDAHNRPIRDAVVQPQGILSDMPNGKKGSTYGTVAGLDPVAVTNDAGEFELSRSTPFDAMVLQVEARGMAPKIFTSLNTGVQRHTLIVTEGATVRGRLVQRGKPVPNAEVGLVARQRGWGPNLALHGYPLPEVRVGTNDDGTFAVTNVPPGVDWYLFGTMDSLAPRGGTGPLECATRTDNEDLNIGDIEVKPGYRLRGRVALSDGKSISEGMRVFIGDDRTDDSQTAILHPDGSFEFGGLPSGKYEVSASVKGYRAPQWDYRTGADRPGTVQIDGDRSDFVLTLNPVK